MKKLSALLLSAVTIAVLCAACSFSGTAKEPYDIVVLVGVDGAGAFFRDVETPCFDRIFKDGRISYDMRAATPTLSSENWGAMFYGVEPEVHGINNLYAKHRHFSHPELHSIFWHVHEAFPDAQLASLVGWTPINTGIIELEEGIDKIPNQASDKGMDGDQLTACFEEYMKTHDNVKLMYVQIDDVDQAGHRFGWGTDEYYEAIKKADEDIGRIYDCLEKNKLTDHCLFIVVSDHGGTIDKTHGGGSETETAAFFAVAGHDVDGEDAVRDMETRDVAAVVLSALQMELPDSFTGRVPAGIWKNTGGGQRIENKNERTISPYRYAFMAESPFLRDSDALKQSVIYYQSFDGQAEQGIFGHAIDCAASSFDTQFTADGAAITIAFWIRAGEIRSDPVIISNKDWSSGKNRGFVIAHHKSDLTVSLGDGENRRDIAFPIPTDYDEGWTHFLFSIDMENRMVTGYCDFMEMYSDGLGDRLITDEVLSNASLVIGQDVTLSYPHALNAQIDDLLIFDHALSAREAAALEKIYACVLQKKDG